MAFNSYAAIEARISEACDAIHDGWYTNFVQADSVYEVPLRRLQGRWNRGASKSTRAPTNKALTEEQEVAIREYIDRLDKINMYARLQMIVGAANYLICFENRTVGHQWLKRFLERNPEYHRRKQKPLAAERKHSHSVHDISDYFEKIERVMREKGITELDVWNMDGTGFRIGSGKAQLVVIMDPNKPPRMIGPENRDYITSVEFIGSAGETIPPILLISGVNILHKWCQHNDLDGDVVIGTTETGYANNDTALEWLQHFIDHTQNKRRGTWLLLIIDGMLFHNPATENKIVLFRLLPHSTHLTRNPAVAPEFIFK